MQTGFERTIDTSDFGGDVAISVNGSQVLAGASGVNFKGLTLTVTNNAGTADVYIPTGAGGLLADRPAAAASNTNVYYFATDNSLLYYSDGATWTTVVAPSIPMSYLDTNGALAANSDAKVPSQKAVKTYVDAITDMVNQPDGIAPLDGAGLLPSNVMQPTVMEYKGSWNAATNVPNDLIDGDVNSNQGDVWKVSASGTQDLGHGSISFVTGDWVVYDGSQWRRTPFNYTKSDVGLGNVNNTSDASKPISTATQTALDAKADLVGGFVATSQIPSLAISDVFTAASQAAMLALTAQRGDVAVRSDTGHRFILSSDSPGTLADWVDLGTSTDAVTSVNSQVGVVVLGKSDIGLSNVPNVDATDRANHTGTQTASTISNFDTAVRTSRLDQMATPSASVAMGSQKLTGLANGTASTDAVNRTQLDARMFKDKVQAATTAAITLSNTQTVDGIALVAGDRCLVKNQASASSNGIWSVVSGGAWTRVTDMDASSELAGGTMVYVEAGTVNAQTTWVCTSTGTLTIGSSNLNFALATVPHDTDGTLAANSDFKVATQKAVKTYVDANASIKQVWIPSTQFYARSGSPTQGLLGSELPVWTFPNAGSAYVSALIHPQFASATYKLVWSSDSTSGSVHWQVSAGRLRDGFASTGTDYILLDGNIASPSGASNVKISTIISSNAQSATDPLFLDVGRDVSDSNNGNAYLLGVIIISG